MSTHRFGSSFPRLFTAALLQELSFFLLIHVPGYFSQLGATEGLIGLLYGLTAVVALAMRPWLGRILDLTHRRTVILVAAFANVVLLVALATTTEWGPILWGLFLAHRTMQIVLLTTMLTFEADSIPVEQRTQGLALLGVAGLVPIAIGGYSGDVLVDALGFTGLFLAAALVSLASWLVVWTLPALEVRGRQPRRSFWAAFAQRNLLPLWLATLLFSIGFEAVFTFTRTFIDARGVGTAGLFFAVYGSVAAITRLAGGRIYKSVAHRALLTLSIAAYGAGLGFMALAQSLPLLLLAAMTAGTAHGVVFPLLASEVVNRARVAERGSAMATFTSLFDVALLVGAPAVGFIIEGFDYLAAFSAVAVALVGGALVYQWWDRRIDASTLIVEEVL